MGSQLDDFRKHPILIVLAAVMLLAFGYVVYYFLVLHPKLENSGWYAVGTAMDTYNPPKGGTVILVDFTVNGEEYTASPPYRKGIKQGSRYLVRFLPENPDICKGLLDCPVPDSIVSIPAEGWEHPPFGCGGR
jgi:hypothetical protein